jgi:sulfatase modifying factor 1
VSDIFLSYDSRDLERIKPLAAALSAQGWTLFYDRTIPPGKTWRQFIGKEIDECRCMVVAWSTHSIESNWVLEEADDGLKRKILVPCLLDDVRPPLGMRAIQAANLVDWKGDLKAPGFKALCGAISELIGAGKEQKVSVQDSGKPAIEHVPHLVEVQPPKTKFDKNAAPKEQAGSKERGAAPKQHKAEIEAPDAMVPDMDKPRRFTFKAMLVTVILSVVGVMFFELGPFVSVLSKETEPKTTAHPSLDNPSPKPASPKVASAIERQHGSADATQVAQRTAIKVPEMISIPAGEFWMGSENTDMYASDDEKPKHKVQIAAFNLGKYEVTKQQFAEFVRQTGHKSGECWFWNGSDWTKSEPRDWQSPGVEQTESEPVVCVSFQDVQAYIAWLNKETGNRFRLPSEAEWEYAARAKTNPPYFWGEAMQEATEHAWFSDNARQKTQPVGQPNHDNAFELYDMAGNVWEWTQDCWHVNYQSAPGDGKAWEQASGGDCNRRVLRGGSWPDEPGILRSAPRGGDFADFRLNNVGFRLAQD